MMAAFPESFYTIGNMPGYYTIQIDPSINIKHIQYGQIKSPKELWSNIEEKLEEMVN